MSNPLCRRCGNARATARLTEIVDGAPQESSVCNPCAKALALGNEDDASRCRACATEIRKADLLQLARSSKEKWGRLGEDASNELLRSAACHRCGAALNLPGLRWAWFADASCAFPIALLARRRPPSDPLLQS
jgi:protein-arginine kinase activator protein McsA